MHSRQQPKTANTIANEINRVFGVDRAFAEFVLHEGCERRYHILVGVFTGYQFNQLH